MNYYLTQTNQKISNCTNTKNNLPFYTHKITQDLIYFQVTTQSQVVFVLLNFTLSEYINKMISLALLTGVNL